LKEVRDSGVLYTNRALCYLRLGLYHRAIEDCDSALDLNGSNLKGFIYKAQALHAMSRSQEAKLLLQDAIKIHPRHEEFIKGNSYIPHLRPTFYLYIFTF
jgi:tetratricopeptide (TPR) repeat protein